jgi:hypothetical protein
VGYKCTRTAAKKYFGVREMNDSRKGWKSHNEEFLVLYSSGIVVR